MITRNTAFKERQHSVNNNKIKTKHNNKNVKTNRC